MIGGNNCKILSQGYFCYNNGVNHTVLCLDEMAAQSVAESGTSLDDNDTFANGKLRVEIILDHFLLERYAYFEDGLIFLIGYQLIY